MKIFYLFDENALCNRDMAEAFRGYRRKGEETVLVPYSFKNVHGRRNPGEEGRMGEAIRQAAPDFVFSFNFFPLVSEVCHKEGLPYVSWTYDSPQVNLYSRTIRYPENYAFLFDSQTYEDLAGRGIPTVYYLPMAASTERLDALVPDAEKEARFSADIAFVGSLYNEKHNLYERMLSKLPPYAHGYVDGLMRAQMQVGGYSFLEECLSGTVLPSLQEALPLYPHEEGMETGAYLFSEYVLCRRMATLERMEILRMIGEKYPVSLYTYEENRGFSPKGVSNKGRADYYDDMPYVFKCSRINLNISLRSIRKGIPLRCFDIMGAGGFLLSNYQEDFLRFFVPGEDFVYYESRQDLMDKIAYYLSHEEERRDICGNGHRKIAEKHTFSVRVGQMMEVVHAGMR